MTTFEHAMLGANAVLASGLHRRYGWHVVVLAGVCAVAPDWDGLTLLYDVQTFDRGHRVWGHNLLACFLTGILLGSIDYRYDLSGRLASYFASKRKPELVPDGSMRRKLGKEFSGWAVWILVGILAALSQIPADSVVSSGHGLSDWPLKPLWPFSQQEFIYPMVQWGDPGITLIFCAGMITMARCQRRLQLVAILTLLLVVGYIEFRGTPSLSLF